MAPDVFALVVRDNIRRQHACLLSICVDNDAVVQVALDDRTSNDTRRLPSGKYSVLALGDAAVQDVATFAGRGGLFRGVYIYRSECKTYAASLDHAVK